MKDMTAYEAIIGLEVHAELKTDSKIFCACSTRFGAPPNTQCCPVCMGYPGTLPVLNRRAVELAVLAGLALNCRINSHCHTDRKHYFYPDLPKAYQISQDARPICEEGFLSFSLNGDRREVGIARIHFEEDAGKLIHTDSETLVDFNRCGVPLIEIVSKPDLRSGAEAAAYLRALRGILVRCGISDCKMQEGSLRCDVNISLRPVGSDSLGVRSEIKNLNSFAFVEKAIGYEIRRQTELLSHGETPSMETRRFDVSKGTTELMRKKESTEDYRYLPEPDLPGILLSKEEIKALKASLPELPMAQAERLVDSFGIRQQEAAILVSDLGLADFFEAVAAKTEFSQQAVHLLLTDLLPHCKEDPFVSPVAGERLAELSDLLGRGEINSSIAKKLLLRLTEKDFSPAEIVKEENLWQIRDEEALQGLVRQAMEKQPRAVLDWQRGKTAAIRSLQGEIMALAKGRAEPRLVQSLLLAALEASKDSKEDFL